MKSITTTFSKIINKKKIKLYKKDALSIAASLDDVREINNDEVISDLKGSILDNKLAVLHCAKLIKSIYDIQPFVSQLTAALAMLDGKFVEMETGEGKTLVFLMVSVIYTLRDRRVVMATANEYLAQRDAEYAKRLTDLLAISSAYLPHQSDNEMKKESCNANIIFCDLNDLILDYLRSSFSKVSSDKLNIPFDIMLIDEADNVLLDKGAVPLTVSKFREADKETLANAIATARDFIVKKDVERGSDLSEYKNIDAFLYADSNNVEITETGFAKYEDFLVSKGVIESAKYLYAPDNLFLISDIEQAVKGIHGFKKGQDYLVHEGRVVPINKHTGRSKVGQFFNAGLQQAIEVKEGVAVTQMGYAFASMSVQHYVLLHNEIIGMSGTLTENKDELNSSFGADIICIDRNNPLKRIDEGDLVFIEQKVRTKHAIRDIVRAQKKGQPVLACTSNEKESESLSNQLKSLMIPNKVISNSNQREEAEIIRNAGIKGSVTITTGMSGRGTDIILGGDPSLYESIEEHRAQQEAVRGAGGLFVAQLGKQRLAKQDRQLIGRSGRQGDPGRTACYISMEDSSLKMFNLGRLQQFILDAGADKEKPINNNIVNKSIIQAQKTVLDEDFKFRKYISSQMEESERQRVILFELRDTWLYAEGDDFIEYIKDAFDTDVSDRDLVELKENILDIFDQTYLNYRVKVSELTGNLLLRGQAVINMKHEAKKTLFKTFEIFISTFKTEVSELIGKKG